MSVELEPPPPAADLLVDGRPDWSRIDFDIECPRCGYNVRMLESPRCPECGLEFSWHDLLHAHFTTNRFLFEHQWRNRPVGSFLITAVKSFRPWRFWSEVSLYDHLRVWPLWLYLFLSLVATFVVLHGGATAGHLLLDRLEQRQPLPRLLAHANDFFRFASFPDLVRKPRSLYLDWANTCILLGSLGLLCLLDETLGRCRVRRAQLLRVLAYTALPGLLLTAIWIPTVLFITSHFESPFQSAVAIVFLVLLVASAAAPFGLLLSIGLKHYLKLPRPYVLGITAAFVGLLAAVAVPTGISQLFR